MAIKIGVSGFGRISRVVIRAAMDMPEIEIAGINVRNADKEYMVYMLKYDTVFGRFPKELDVYEDGIIIDGKRVPVYSESDAANIPWSECGAEYIVEGTGAYNTTEKAMVHINQGAKKVIITAIATDGSGKKKTFVIRVMKGEVKKITIKGKKSVKAGKTVKLKAVVKASKGANKKLRWTSNNTKYATVTSSGKVKTKKAGKKKTIKITAMATDGSNKKATIKIKLK